MTLLLEWTGPAILIASLTQNHPVRFRLLNIAASFVFILFNLAIGLTSMVLLNLILIALNTTQLVRLRTIDRLRAIGHDEPAPAVSSTC